MISVEKALKTILAKVKPLDPETVRLSGSLNRVIAGDIYSGMDVPAFDNSAMDGYAVKALDTRGASKEKNRTLRVVEDIKAGSVAKSTLKTGQAIRIMTGAPIPKGADSVVMVEDTKTGIGHVETFKEAAREDNIRRRGEDIKKGEMVIGRGTLVRPAHVGVLASLGISSVRVTKRPRIAFLATGDELVSINKKIAPGKLHSSNTYSLYSQIISCGGIPKDLGISKDRPAELAAKIRKGLDCDMILTSGGVSVGDHDLVKQVLAEMGTDIKFWKVAMRPGKPLAFGRMGKVLVFGLPGNPVSSMVSFEIFVRPAILKMLGTKEGRLDGIDAVLEESVAKRKDLRYFLRARTRWENGVFMTRTTGAQGSGILRSMALANSLIILPEDVESVKKGEKVKIRFLE